MRSALKPSIQKILVGFVIVIVLAFILLRGDQLVELAETMKRGAIIPLVLAILTQLGKYYAQSWAYHFAFAAVGEKMNPRDTLPLVFGTFFMNTIAPSLNMAGATLVVDDARRRGIPGGKATSAALLMQMTIESGFMTIMIVGFIILQFTGNLSPVWFLLGLFVVFLVAFMGGIMVVGRKSPRTLVGFLRPVEGLVNKIITRFGKKALSPWAEKAVDSFGEAAGIIARNPKPAFKSFACSIVASTCELSAFCLVGISFNIYNPESLICGYVVATLFAMISITPQGVGVVEAAVMVLFSAYNVNSAAGMAAVLVYRGLVFWMPFLIGAVLIQRTKTFKRDDGKKKARKFLPGRTVPVEKLPEKGLPDEGGAGKSASGRVDAAVDVDVKGHNAPDGVNAADADSAENAGMPDLEGVGSSDAGNGAAHVEAVGGDADAAAGDANAVVGGVDGVAAEEEEAAAKPVS